MRRSLPFRLLMFGLFVSGLVVGGLLVAFWLVLPRSFPLGAQAVPTAMPTPTLPADTVFAQVEALDTVMTNLYQRVSPSVVHITSRSQTETFYGIEPSEGTGSGFVYDNQGHIITNNHVIEGATEVDVLLANGASLPAQVVGADAYYDLAVIKVDVTANILTPLELGDSAQLKVGQRVIAIGNPFGLDRTLTSGLISALERRVETNATSIIGQAIQTDAAINPGNSGGPLLDLRGRVVGINTAINSPSGGSVGIGFAVPVNIVKRVVPVLISKGSYPHPTLGINVAELGVNVTPPSSGPQRGLLITQLDPNGPAVKAGLKAATVTIQRRRYVFSGGDIITAVDGKAVATKNDLLLALEEKFKPGDTVELTVYRDGKTIPVTATLGEQ
ncbi:MAG: trypsin-like peptidase domain-containing protein [Anaerolineae bacterium]|nr:trypsin-like peptidase domain-containing protein [Anaerolineae bacterium]